MKTNKHRLYGLVAILVGLLTVFSGLAVPVMAASSDTIEYTSYTSHNAIDILYGSSWRAQTFTPAKTHTITTVSLALLRMGNPAGDITVSIRATNSSGLPTGADLATGSIRASSVIAAWSPTTWFDFDLGAGCTVTAGKTYAIVWRAPSATSGNPVYYWANTSGGYNGGALLYGSSGSTWANLRTWDACFKESGPSSQPSPTTTTPVAGVQESNIKYNAIDIFYGASWRAQTFTPDKTHTVKSVSLALLRTGNPAGDITVSIRATDSSGLPAGADLATGSIRANSVIAAWSPVTWYDFNLGAGCTVTAGKTYAIIWRAPSTTSGSPIYYWANTSGGYDGGKLLYGSNGSSWSNLRTWDACFKESGSTTSLPTPTTTTPTTPPPTTTTPTVTPNTGVRNVGFVSIYFLDSIVNRVDWDQYTHFIWQNLMVNSGSDPTLRVQDGYPWSQLTTFVNACHANDVKALVCLFGTGDLNSITSNPTLRGRLVANLTNVIKQYGLDGINIDWEGSNSPTNYATFIRELRASLGSGKIITAIGTFLGPPVNIDPSAEPYLDFVTVMTYDYWHVPSNGSLDVVAGTMQMWNKQGFPKDKLVMGIPFFATTAAGTTGWTPYSRIVSSYSLSPSQNSGWGYYWNGVDLVKAKTRWVVENGYGGVFNYETGTDVLGHSLSLSNAIYQALNGS